MRIIKLKKGSLNRFLEAVSSDTDLWAPVKKGEDKHQFKVVKNLEEIDLAKTYRGAEDQQIGWTLEETPPSGYMSLWRKYRPYEMVVAYALTYIYSPKKQTIPFLFGTDDGSKVFLNGKEIYRYLGVRIAEPDQERISLNLKKGWNTLLLKIENNFGGYAFYARVIDREGSLVIKPNK